MSSPSAKLTIQIDKMVRNLLKINNDIFKELIKYFNKFGLFISNFFKKDYLKDYLQLNS